MPSIYIINPAAGLPSYYSGEFFSGEGMQWVQVADLTIATVAAFAPRDWEIQLVDEGVSPADLEADVDFVAITGKVSQRARMIELAREFRSRGRTVLIGGSFASLTPDDMRPHADILVTGELEEIAPRLFADLASGAWRDRYDGGNADIRLSPLPRWDLYPVDRAFYGALQTTRGCPFNCEFCDVIQYQGRKQRHKDIDQVLAELDELHRQGFRKIFVVDDNFTVHRQWAHTVLDAFADWNARRPDDPVTFITQTSLDIAREDELMEKCAAAGLRTLFVGVETIDEASLRETRKKQNLLMPIPQAVNRILAHGIAVQAGIIVGFDHDDRSTFARLTSFFQSSPLPVLTIGVLTAPRATDLYRRLARENRLDGDIWDAAAASPFATNIAPLKMSRDELLDGVADLCRAAYSPAHFEQRMLNLIDAFTPWKPNAVKGHSSAESVRLFFRTLHKISALGPAEAGMVSRVLRAAGRKPAVLPIVVAFLTLYGQARYFIDEAVARRSAPRSPKPLHPEARGRLGLAST
jgi:radical SAM superfamily enzyme YgiQ (UPF0313 family)